MLPSKRNSGSAVAGRTEPVSCGEMFVKTKQGGKKKKKANNKHPQTTVVFVLRLFSGKWSPPPKKGRRRRRKTYNGSAVERWKRALHLTQRTNTLMMMNNNNIKPMKLPRRKTSEELADEKRRQEIAQSLSALGVNNGGAGACVYVSLTLKLAS